MKIKGNRFEFTFDASSARIANYSTKSLVVVDSVNEGGSTKHRTFIKRLDKLNGFTFENDLGEVINLTNNVTENVNQLLRAGMKFNNADTKDITQKGAELNKEADTYEPQYINVIVNFKSDTSGDDYECIELAFERPRSANEATVTLSEVLEMLSYDMNFNELAAEKLANGGRIVGATTEDGKSIIPSAKIFNDTEIWCQWNEPSKSWTREEAGIDDTSDEFTYVKTPGKISKLFVHVGYFSPSTLTDTYANYQSGFDFANDENYNRVTDYGSNNPVQVIKQIKNSPALQLRTYAKLNSGRVELGSYEPGGSGNIRFMLAGKENLENGKLYDFLDPLVYVNNGVAVLKDSCGTPLSEPWDDVFTSAIQPRGVSDYIIHSDIESDMYSTGRYDKINRINVVNHVTATVVIPVNITMNSKLSDLKDALCNTIAYEAYDPVLRNLLYYNDGSGTYLTAYEYDTQHNNTNTEFMRMFTSETVSEFSHGGNGFVPYVVSPELVYRHTGSYEYSTHNIASEYYKNYTFEELYERQINPEQFGSIRNSVLDEAGISCNWCGVHIVKKAIEEGRALDVFLEPDIDCEWLSSPDYYDYL